MTDSPRDTAVRKVLVWDLPTRLFHWALVVCLCVSWYTGSYGPIDLHFQAGYVALTLVIFRLIWGIAGSRTARFAAFVASPLTAARHLKDSLTGRHEPTLGHNAAGGWSVVVLLALVLLQASLGLFSNDDIFSQGPLASLVTKSTSDWLTSLHKANVNVLLAFIALHLCAIGFYLIKGDNLIAPMVTGRKRWNGAAPDATAPLWRAAVALAAATAIVWYVVNEL